MLMKENKDLDAILKEKQVRVENAVGKLIVDTDVDGCEVTYIYDDGTYSRIQAQSDYDSSWFENDRIYESEVVFTRYNEPFKCEYKLSTLGEKLLDYKVIKKSAIDEYIKKLEERKRKTTIENANSRLQRGLQEVIGSYKAIVENAIGLEENSKKLLDQLKETISKHVHITL